MVRSRKLDCEHLVVLDKREAKAGVSMAFYSQAREVNLAVCVVLEMFLERHLMLERDHKAIHCHWEIRVLR